MGGGVVWQYLCYALGALRSVCHKINRPPRCCCGSNHWHCCGTLSKRLCQVGLLAAQPLPCCTFACPAATPHLCRYADKQYMEVGLLFTCRLGNVDLERPVGEAGGRGGGGAGAVVRFFIKKAKKEAVVAAAGLGFQGSAAQRLLGSAGLGTLFLLGLEILF